MPFQKQNSCQLLTLTTPCQKRRKKCRSVHYWLISVRILWFSTGSFCGLLLYELVSSSIIILCCSNLMLRDMTNSTAELSGASHQVIEVKVGGFAPCLAFRFPSLCLSQSAPVSALCSLGFLWNFRCSFIFMWLLNFPVSCSVKPLNFYVISRLNLYLV